MRLTKLFTLLITLTFSLVALAASDSQIIKTIMNTNEGEISLGKLAQKKATHEKVKKYAEEMVSEHESNNQKLSQLSKKLKVSPEASFTSEKVTLKAEKDMAMLKIKKGGNFDQAYLDSQIHSHKQVLESLDNKLIPEAKNEELKNLLQTTRSTVTGHLNEAQELRKSI